MTDGEKNDHSSSGEVSALSLLSDLKTELGHDLVEGVPDRQLLKFLHWKKDVNRAAERFRAHLKWRHENPWAFGDDEKHKRLRISDDPTVARLLGTGFVIAPASLTSSKYDGAAVVVGRLRRNDMKDGRTPTDVCRSMLYLIDQTIEREEVQLHGIVVFHDLRGLGKDNIHPAIPKMLLGALLGNLPLRIRGLYLLNAPWFFKLLFGTMSNLFFPKKLKERTHFINKLDDIYDVVEKEKLLTEHGGEVEFNPETWVEEKRRLEENSELGSLYNCMVKR